MIFPSPQIAERYNAKVTCAILRLVVGCNATYFYVIEFTRIEQSELR